MFDPLSLFITALIMAVIHKPLKFFYKDKIIKILSYYAKYKTWQKFKSSMVKARNANLSTQDLIELFKEEIHQLNEMYILGHPFFFKHEKVLRKFWFSSPQAYHLVYNNIMFFTAIERQVYEALGQIKQPSESDLNEVNKLPSKQKDIVSNFSKLFES